MKNACYKLKKAGYIFVICMTVAVFAFLFSCTSSEITQLTAPCNFRFEHSAIVWDEVENADGYEVCYKDVWYNVTAPLFQIPDYNDCNAFSVTVYAKSNSDKYDYSPDATFDCVKEKTEIVTEGTAKLVYTLLSDGSGYEVSRGNASLVGDVVIPDYYNGKPVLKIAEKGFGDPEKDFVLNVGPKNNYTKSVRLPQFLREIGDYGFWGLTAVTEFKIPESVNSIGRSAFEWCSELTEINVPYGITVISEEVFKRTNIEKIKLPDSVRKIEDEAFRSCAKLTDITIPNGVSIGTSCFPRAWIDSHPNGFVTVGEYVVGYSGEIPDGEITQFPENVKYIAG